MLIYPDVALEEGYGFPSTEQFQIAEREDGKGKAVYTLSGHARGEMIGRFTGLIVPYRTQHSLQLNPNLHVLDLHFIGYLAHSCSPNAFVDMQEFEVWALEDIAPLLHQRTCGRSITIGEPSALPQTPSTGAWRSASPSGLNHAPTVRRLDTVNCSQFNHDQPCADWMP